MVYGLRPNHAGDGSVYPTKAAVGVHDGASHLYPPPAETWVADGRVGRPYGLDGLNGREGQRHHALHAVRYATKSVIKRCFLS